MTIKNRPYFVTFGANHLDSNGESLGDNFCVIQAANESATREILWGLRGPLWAFIYKSKDDAGVVRFNLTETTVKNITLNKE